MEQRTLRLGDIVDDYCPRERRLTNHAIVAVVGDTIKHTRCTTCDAEHVYKNGREPRIRKKAGETLYDQVLGDLTGGQLVTKPSDAAGANTPAEPAAPAADNPGAKAQGSAEAPPATAEQTDAEKSDADAKADAWLAHRRLIRAALPKTEGELPPQRPIPEFTMYQRPQGRGGRPFRYGGGGGGGMNNGNERNGNVAHPRDGRPSGPGPHSNGGSNGSNRGPWQGGGEGAGQGGRPPGGGGRRRGRRKRSGGGGGAGGGRGPAN